MKLVAPFPYVGGKASIAHYVWAALGQPRHYMEPFFGSGAVLLARPDYNPSIHIETVNDADGYLCNVWRALQFSPDEVARWCDWPVNHIDLFARRKELIAREQYLINGLASSPEWHDAKLAGYWIWAASCWIGAGMIESAQTTHEENNYEVLHALGQRPHLSNGGNGIHKLSQRSHFTNSGESIHRLGRRPHLSDSGESIHEQSQIPYTLDDNADVREPYNINIYAWFRQLSERLRYVRVTHGDWTRICGGNWQDSMGTVGIFFDPPYSSSVGRNTNLYHKDSGTVSNEVRAWCKERGRLPSYRIVLCGYEGEHEELESLGWTVLKWKAQGGYANIGNGQGKENRFRERIWFSPHCLTSLPLFAELEQS